MGSKELSNAVKFLQSYNDFPLTVALGRKTPSFGLYRYKQGLNFVPLDDECFTLRGDRQRLLYKGRRRSHRFSILGDTSFEYDCILEREPESNVITLLIDGAEHFDFFRQPDFVSNPFMKGSYAVYKKNTFIGEGTGKLCHIHKPLIIDALGRRVWGELSVDGNMLRITIPEGWLATAKYPVVVDPTIGTTTVGVRSSWLNPAINNLEQLVIKNAIAVNRYLLPEVLRETALAYVYIYDGYGGDLCKPVIYSDNNNTPLSRLSTDEGNIDIKLTSTNRSGWRYTEFGITENIPGGSYIWFGLLCDRFAPSFDYGTNCFIESHAGNTAPNTYPLINANNYYDLKLSMYFDYQSAFFYKRTLTQGVKLTDNRKITSEYKRTTIQTVKGSDIAGRFATFMRQCVSNVTNSAIVEKSVGILRTIQQQIEVFSDIAKEKEIITKIIEIVKVEDIAIKSILFFVRIVTQVFSRGYLLQRFLVAREELKLKSCITTDLIIESKIK